MSIVQMSVLYLLAAILVGIIVVLIAAAHRRVFEHRRDRASEHRDWDAIFGYQRSFRGQIRWWQRLLGRS